MYLLGWILLKLGIHQCGPDVHDNLHDLVNSKCLLVAFSVKSCTQQNVIRLYIRHLFTCHTRVRQAHTGFPASVTGLAVTRA